MGSGELSVEKAHWIRMWERLSADSWDTHMATLTYLYKQTGIQLLVLL